jgi:hypothetical protein
LFIEFSACFSLSAVKVIKIVVLFRKPLLNKKNTIKEQANELKHELSQEREVLVLDLILPPLAQNCRQK